MTKHILAVLFVTPVLSFGQAAGAAAPTPQVINFTDPGTQSVGISSIMIVATTSASGLNVTLQTSTPGVCTVSGSSSPFNLTFAAAGICTLTASQPGGASGGTTYSAATPVTHTITVTSEFPGVDVVLGIGSLITANRTNYTVNTTTNVLEGTQIGRASPQLLAGLAFQLPMRGFKSRKGEDKSEAHKWDDKYRPFHAFVSLKFSTDTNTPLVGYTFGGTYRVQKYLDFLMGYTLTQFMEPSPGFRNAAAAVVAGNPTLYPTFNVSDMNNNHAGAFDGFPTQCVVGAINCGGSTAAAPATKGTPLYAGDITEPHFRGGFMIGISVPISLNNLFGIPKANPSSTQ